MSQLDEDDDEPIYDRLRATENQSSQVLYPILPQILYPIAISHIYITLKMCDIHVHISAPRQMYTSVHVVRSLRVVEIVRGSRGFEGEGTVYGTTFLPSRLRRTSELLNELDQVRLFRD